MINSYSGANLYMTPSFLGKMKGDISTFIDVQEESMRMDELDVSREPKGKHHKKCKFGFILLLFYGFWTFTISFKHLILNTLTMIGSLFSYMW